MKDFANSFVSKYVDEATGAIRWPDAEDERRELAQALFGAVAVHAFEDWLAIARDLLRNPRTARPWGDPSCDAAVEDAAFRDVFGTFNETQKLAVLRLVKKSMDGLVFSLLASFDQFPGGELRIELGVSGDDDNYEHDDSPPQVQIAPSHPAQLHENWGWWLSQFSSASDVDGPALWDVKLGGDDESKSGS